MGTATNSRALSPTYSGLTSDRTMPEVYAARGIGTCMEPLIADGTLLAFDRTAKVRNGDVVGIWLKPEHVPAGGDQHMVKRLLVGPPLEGFPIPKGCLPAVVVEMLNPRRCISFDASHIMAIHKCVGVAKSLGNGMARYKPGEGGFQ